MIVIGDIKYMTSAGNPEKVKGAKNAIMYAVIGLVVTLLAFAITEVIIGALDGKTSEESTQTGGGSGGGGGYTGGKGTLTADQRKKIVEFARTQIGVEYNWGPGGQCSGGAWDNDIPGKQLACNGLTRWSYNAAGITIPKGSIDQITQAPYVTSTGKVSDMTAGDIIVFDDVGRRSDIPNIRIWSFRHVAIYAGDGVMIEATCPVARQTHIGDNEYSYSVTC